MPNIAPRYLGDVSEVATWRVALDGQLPFFTSIPFLRVLRGRLVFARELDGVRTANESAPGRSHL